MRSFVVISMISLFLGATTLLTPLGTNHGCASSNPPAVTGPLVQPSTAYHTLFINEVLLAPQSTWNCSEPPGQSTASNDTWLEIYNPSPDQAFDLYSTRTQLDGGPNTNAFLFPFGAAIAPHSFLAIFPIERLQPFQPSASRDLRLLISGIVVDEVTVPLLSPDTSYARIPDGSASWQITTTPSIATANVLLPLPTKTPVTSSATKTTSTSTPPATATTRSSTKAQGTLLPTTTHLASGTQPAWKNVQMPTTSILTSFTPLADHSTSLVPSPSAPNSNNVDLPKHIILTLLSVSLALVLLWFCHLFIRT